MATAKKELIQGLWEYRNLKNGFVVLELHYTADPAKRSPIWRQRESVGIMPTDWAREYELSWVVKTGRPVFSDYFTREWHVFGPSTSRGDLELPKAARLVVGYDMGPTASRLAASFNLFEEKIPRRWTIDEVYAERASIDEFLDLVELKLVSWGYWGDAIHVVDPTAIESISRIEERACVDLMRLRGIEPFPGERSFVKRRQHVEGVLEKMPRGFPHYNVHERCTMHIEGFEGGYHYPELSASRGGGFGAIPVKNGYSDIHDALQYALSRTDIVFTTPTMDGNTWVNSYAVRQAGTPPRIPEPQPGTARIVIGNVGL